MIVNEDARLKHLKEAFRVLKSKGVYFSCNIGGDKPTEITDLARAMPRPGSLTPRKIKVDGAEREIMLPIIAAWPRSGEQYRTEFENTGYNVLKLYKRITRVLGSCWIVIAEKLAGDTL